MKLVSHWRLWHRRWSTWLSFLNSSAWTAVAAHSNVLLAFVPFLPEWLLLPALVVLFVVLWLLPVAAVSIRQPALKSAAERKRIIERMKRG